ncbi:hypothetical protein [Saliphagus sp. LR7]|uniref:hypothetical protein n=1 Tax=Saliphagus sp. LR7 TaxID=2282654 RepID=UPI000DF83321|nr:hypothetical protein [Saliphagus sp. LR7]
MNALVVTPFDIAASRGGLNAILGWLLMAVMGLAVVHYCLAGEWLWGSFTLGCLLVSLFPPWRMRNWKAMAPGPLLLIVTVGVLAGGNQLYPETAGYVAVGSLGVLIAIELDVFTSVEMTRRFALGFAVLSTLAVQGLWTIGQYYSDVWFETGFLTSQRELQIDIVIVTVVGVTIGLLSEWYFTRVSHIGSHIRPSNSSRSR